MESLWRQCVGFCRFRLEWEVCPKVMWKSFCNDNNPSLLKLLDLEFSQRLMQGLHPMYWLISNVPEYAQAGCPQHKLGTCRKLDFDSPFDLKSWQAVEPVHVDHQSSYVPDPLLKISPAESRPCHVCESCHTLEQTQTQWVRCKAAD